jgi:hypothetical protein
MLPSEGNSENQACHDGTGADSFHVEETCETVVSHPIPSENLAPYRPEAAGVSKNTFERLVTYHENPVTQIISQIIILYSSIFMWFMCKGQCTKPRPCSPVYKYQQWQIWRTHILIVFMYVDLTAIQLQYILTKPYTWSLFLVGDTHRMLVTAYRYKSCRRKPSISSFMLSTKQGISTTEQFGNCTSKIPPSWDPGWESEYPYHIYAQDVELWAVGVCELQIAQIGPAVALRLQGAAREIVRELNTNILMNGRQVIDANQQAHQQSGLEYLLDILRSKFGILPQEYSIKCISDFLNIKKHNSENTDQFVSRFEVLRYRASQNAGMQITEPGSAWMILMLLGIPTTQWTILLFQTAGALPTTREQYSAFIMYLRRNGHLYDRSNNTIKQQFLQIPGSNSSQQDSSPPSLFYGGETSEQQDDNSDASSVSSCWSNDEDEVTFEDVQDLDYQDAGEKLYMQYRFAKRRWRRFSGPGRHARSRFHRRSKGKGRSFRPGRDFHRGKHRGRMFYGGPSVTEIYNAKPISRTNPLGPDGQPLQCSICNSTEHFRARCPQARKGGGKPFGKSGKGGGKGKRQGKAFFGNELDYNPEEEWWDTPEEEQQSTTSGQAPTASNRTVWFHNTATGRTPDFSPKASEHMMLLDDGSIIYFNQRASSSHEEDTSIQAVSLTSHHIDDSAVYTAAPRSQFMEFVTWLGKHTGETLGAAVASVFHSEVRLSGKEGLLIDTGAVENITGMDFVDRIKKLVKNHGQGVLIKPLETSISVGGIGQGDDSCENSVTLPACLADGHVGTYTAPVINNRQIPALLGLESMTRQRAIIDTHNNIMICAGQGGYKLNLSPGSKTYKLEKSKTGHLFLPITEWQKFSSRSSSSNAHPIPVNNMSSSKMNL